MLLFITLLSVAVAIIMSGVAWRLARDERRRSETRVAVLAAEIYRDEDPTPVGLNELFEAEAPPRSQGSLVKALGAGVLVVGSLIAMAVVFTGEPQPSSSAASVAGGDAGGRGTVSASALFPLELTALGHERDRDRLTVRGLVRNGTGETLSGPVMAVVSVFDRHGNLVGTGRAAVERRTLEAGVESKFVVGMAGVADVYRYRVRFMIDDRTVAHVDRRDHSVTAQLP